MLRGGWGCSPRAVQGATEQTLNNPRAWAERPGKHLVRSEWGGSVVTPWGKARSPMWLMSQESAGWWTGQGTQTWKAQDGTWPCRPSEVKVAQSCPTATPRTRQSMEFSRPEYWDGWPFPSPWDPPNPGIKPRFLSLLVDSLPAEPQRKSKNTRVGSLSLLQRIFQTQELNWGLLHCRRILHQLSYQGSPADQVRCWNFHSHHDGKPMESSEQSTDIIWVNILK